MKRDEYCMKKPLEDLVVLDFTRYIAGPYATFYLAQMGAYVIKVEKAVVGDDLRLYPPIHNGESLAYPTYNFLKRSLSMDLRNQTAKDILLKLLPHVDVIAQNYRAGTIEKMGFDWETIHQINPRLIMANNSGFGQNGPYSRRLAFDSIIQSEAGIVNTVAEDSGGIPYYPGGNLSDHMGALYYAAAILGAVNQRDRTGEGQYLEVDMLSASAAMLSPELCLFGATGHSANIETLAPCGFYRDKDGKYLQISCPENRWEALKTLVRDPALEAEMFSSFKGRAEHRAELNLVIQNWVGTQEGERLWRLLESEGIGAGVVRDYPDILNNEHVRASGYFKEVEVPYIGTAPFPDMPVTLSSAPSEYRRAPKLGEDNEEVLSRFLGMSPEQVAALREKGVLYYSEHARWK